MQPIFWSYNTRTETEEKQTNEWLFTIKYCYVGGSGIRRWMAYREQEDWEPINCHREIGKCSAEAVLGGIFIIEFNFQMIGALVDTQNTHFLW